MPDPKNYDTRDEFMKVCIPMVMKEGTAEDNKQAVAICSSMWDRRNKKAMRASIETKHVGGHIDEIKTATRNGVEVGIVTGHLAAWSADRGGIYGIPDQFHQGAFVESLADYKARGMAPIPLRDYHGRTIGGFPIESAHEDIKGLAVVGEINLEVAQGREAFALAKQRVYHSFSIAFKALMDRIEGGIRHIYKALIIEGSICDDPINYDAAIAEVKSMFHDLPIAGKEHPWDSDGATIRVSLSANPYMGYIRCGESKSVLIADVIDGSLMIIPSALMEAAEEVKAMERGMERDAAINTIERYCSKMGTKSPFALEERQFFGADDVKAMVPADIERILSATGSFSKKAATMLANRIGVNTSMDMVKLLREIKQIKV